MKSLSISLSLCNIVSAGISFFSILIYTHAFGLTEIGILATVTSVTALLMPLMTFRLDLAFQRLPKDERPSLTASMLVWILGASSLTGVLLSGVFLLFGREYFSLLVIAIPFHLGLSAANQALWAQNVCDRELGRVAVLQVVRAALASILPFALVHVMRIEEALIVGQLLAQLVLVFFLPGFRHFRPAALFQRVTWVRESASDLVYDNTWPLLINTASLHINPILAAWIFGPDAASIIWIVLRVFLTPSSMIADPIRRDYYANYTDGRRILIDVRRAVLRHKLGFCTVGAMSIGCYFLAVSEFGVYIPVEALRLYPIVFALGVAWAWAILFNAPSTGLIPVLGMARMQTIVELVGFIARVGALMLGFFGVEMINCLTVFLVLTVSVNLCFGVLIDFRIWQHARQ